MSTILKFDSNNLDSIISKYGVSNTWLSLLFTHLSNRKNFEYILTSNEFKKAKKLPIDYLEGLSIGEVSILYEYSMAKSDSKSRKSNGQFFTPDDVSNFMASYSLDFGPGVWLDPCSGIGNLSWHLVAAQKDPEDFLLNNVILSDKDELALLVARCLLTVSFQRKHSKLFEQIKPNFIKFDFLSVADNGENDLFSASGTLQEIPKHDFVIVNPPYLATKMDARFETGKAGDLYAYFLENIIKSSRGFISITPQSFTNAKKFKALRRILLENFPDLKIFTFDNVPANIFKGIKFGSTNSNTANSMRAAITIAHAKPGIPQITSLIRWRTSERELMFQKVEDFLSNVPLTEEFFPKVSKDYESLFIKLINSKTLRTICSTKKTKFPLYIPSAPRYFIPALKKPAKRSSQKVIYLMSEADRNYAYLLINSSLLYWWWRVRDGGMTLSLETLLTLPLPDFKVDKNLVASLEQSEKTSKVYKQNAGSPQENVKHPKSLINDLNRVVFPDFSELLGRLHDNSEITRTIKE